MATKKGVALYSVIIGLAVVAVTGWSIALRWGDRASADSTLEVNHVDREEVNALFQDVFHRPADTAGLNFFVGKDLRQVLHDIQNSDENRYYGALFKAVKAYEEARRAPGTLSTAEVASYKQLIDSALSNLLAWVDTLPQQDPCQAVIDSEDAKQALEDAHNRLDAQAQLESEHGFHDDNEDVGSPENIRIFTACVTPTPTPSVSVSPTASPSVSPTPTPSTAQ